MIISVGTEKIFDKIKHLFMIKNDHKLRIKNFVNLIKNIYINTTVHITPNGEKPKAHPLRSEIKKECFLSIFLINIVLDGVPSQSYDIIK